MAAGRYCWRVRCSGAAGLIGVGLAGFAGYLAAWVLIGFGISTGLYDAVFAALGAYGAAARQSRSPTSRCSAARQHGAGRSAFMIERRLALPVFSMRACICWWRCCCKWRWCGAHPRQPTSKRRATKSRAGGHS
jgi:hypothetical protein